VTNLNEIGKLIQLRVKASDPELDEMFHAAMVHILAVPKAEHDRRNFAFYGVVGALLFFFIATGVVALLATLKVITVEDKYLTMLWGSFIVETIALGGWLIRQTFGAPS
jgi:hypothetical protein